MINPLLPWFTPTMNAAFFIDAFQGVKRDLTDKIITDPTLNRAAHNYINSQTEFAKMLTNNAVDLAHYSMDCITNRYFPKKD
jgi:hypothetical protein